MKGIFLLIIINILCTGKVNAHPVHVSVINIYFEDLTMYIHINSFVDDWETAYFHYTGEMPHFRNRKIFENEWFNEYFNASFSIKETQNDEPIVLCKDTVFFNDMAMTVKLHANLNNKPKSLYIYNAILTDIFADQTNLLIFSHNEKEKGIKFDVKHNEDVLMLK